MPTPPTKLTAAELRQFHETTAALPLRLGMPHTPHDVRTVTGALSWVRQYATHAAEEVARLEARAQENHRSTIVLRALRRDLVNAVDTLRDLGEVE